jgi:hypothetical protein
MRSLNTEECRAAGRVDERQQCCLQTSVCGGGEESTGASCPL